MEFSMEISMEFSMEFHGKFHDLTERFSPGIALTYLHGNVFTKFNIILQQKCG
jgi:hypothetical protein